MTDPQTVDVRGLIEEHIERHPHAQPEDFYKVLYQASFGPAHAVLNYASALAKLNEEVNDMDLSHPREWEDSLDPLDDAYGVARVHLRPYLRVGGSLERLARAMLRSAELVPSAEDPAALQRFGQALGELRVVLRESLDSLEFTGKALDQFLHRVASERFPAVHHSETYREMYDPHYRVVVPETFEEDEP